MNYYIKLTIGIEINLNLMKLKKMKLIIIKKNIIIYKQMNEFELNSKSITELVFTIFGSNESNDDEEY